MDISEAIELLKEYLGELENLRTLRYENEKRWLWKNKVDVVLEAAFGNLTYEYDKLNPPVVLTEYGFSGEAAQSKYLDNLKQYETGIKQILDKYKILGIERISKLQKILQWFNSHLIQRLFHWTKSNKLWSIFIVAIPVLAALIYVIDYFVKLFGK